LPALPADFAGMIEIRMTHFRKIGSTLKKIVARVSWVAYSGNPFC